MAYEHRCRVAYIWMGWIQSNFKLTGLVLDKQGKDATKAVSGFRKETWVRLVGPHHFGILNGYVLNIQPHHDFKKRFTHLICQNLMSNMKF